MIYIINTEIIIPKNISGTVFTLTITSPFGTTTIFNEERVTSDEGYYYIFTAPTLDLEVGEYVYTLINEDGEKQTGLLTYGDYTPVKVKSLNNENKVTQWKNK